MPQSAKSTGLSKCESLRRSLPTSSMGGGSRSACCDVRNLTSLPLRTTGTAGINRGKCKELSRGGRGWSRGRAILEWQDSGIASINTRLMVATYKVVLVAGKPDSQDHSKAIPITILNMHQVARAVNALLGSFICLRSQWEKISIIAPLIEASCDLCSWV